MERTATDLEYATWADIRIGGLGSGINDRKMTTMLNLTQIFVIISLILTYGFRKPFVKTC